MTSFPTISVPCVFYVSCIPVHCANLPSALICARGVVAGVLCVVWCERCALHGIGPPWSLSYRREGSNVLKPVSSLSVLGSNPEEGVEVEQQSSHNEDPQPKVEHRPSETGARLFAPATVLWQLYVLILGLFASFFMSSAALHSCA
eukprot:scaffold2859_cov349-Pavlova_lutheri.AAC.51